MSSGDGLVGLCARCLHHRVVTNSRGSRFYLCGLSRTDARLPRYPRLPVFRCPGFEGSDAEGDAPAVGGLGGGEAGAG